MEPNSEADLIHCLENLPAFTSVPFITFGLIELINRYYPYQLLHPDMLKTASKDEVFYCSPGFLSSAVFPLLFTDWIHMETFDAHRIFQVDQLTVAFHHSGGVCLEYIDCFTESFSELLVLTVHVFPNSWACQPILLACLYLSLKTGLHL